MSGGNTENIQDYENKIADLQNEVDVLTAELAEVYASKGWRFLTPFHWLDRQYQRAKRMLKILVLRIRSGVFLSLLKKISQVLRNEGLSGFRVLLNENLEKQQQEEQERLERQSAPPDEVPLLDVEEGPQRPGILFISHEATRTGAPIFLLDLMRYLADKLDMEFYILVRRGGELMSEFRSIGTTILLDTPDRVNPLVLQNLKKRNIKLIYSNTISNGLLQAQLKRLECPILCHVHELAFSIENIFSDENTRRIKETTSLFLAGSKAVADNLAHNLNVPEERIALAYPFIKVDENLRIAKDAAPPLDIPNDTLVVGACGTIAWRKGPDIFLQVARLVLQQTRRPVIFVWVGGPLSTSAYFNLRYDAKMMGIEKNVVFAGSVPSHIPYFSQFDIFALPSREDPFPLVALDAASLGIPIVCFSEAGGTPELVEFDAGIITPYLDIEAMSKSLLQLINDDDLRQNFGKRAQEKIMERHDVSIGGGHILGIIKEYGSGNNIKEINK